MKLEDFEVLCYLWLSKYKRESYNIRRGNRREEIRGSIKKYFLKECGYR